MPCIKKSKFAKSHKRFAKCNKKTFKYIKKLRGGGQSLFDIITQKYKSMIKTNSSEIIIGDILIAEPPKNSNNSNKSKNSNNSNNSNNTIKKFLTNPDKCIIKPVCKGGALCKYSYKPNDNKSDLKFAGSYDSSTYYKFKDIYKNGKYPSLYANAQAIQDEAKWFAISQENFDSLKKDLLETKM